MMTIFIILKKSGTSCVIILPHNTVIFHSKNFSLKNKNYGTHVSKGPLDIDGKLDFFLFLFYLEFHRVCVENIM